MQMIFYFINCHLLSFCFLSVIFWTRFGYDGSIFSPSKRKFVLFHIITNRKKNKKKNNGFGRWRDGWDVIDKKGENLIVTNTPSPRFDVFYHYIRFLLCKYCGKTELSLSYIPWSLRVRFSHENRHIFSKRCYKYLKIYL